MARAIFSRKFNATDPKKGVSLRIFPDPKPQTFPAWAVARAVEAGAAERVKPQRRVKSGASKQKGS